MIIIEGRTEKIKVVKEQMKARDKDGKKTILFINNSDNPNAEALIDHITPMDYVLTSRDTVEKVIGQLLEDLDSLRDIEMIVFYSNCKLDEVRHVKSLEKKLKRYGNLKHCIITVQSPEQERILVYEI